MMMNYPSFSFYRQQEPRNFSYSCPSPPTFEIKLDMHDRELICTALDLFIPQQPYSSAKNLFAKVRSEGRNYRLSLYITNHLAQTPLSIF